MWGLQTVGLNKDRTMRGSNSKTILFKTFSQPLIKKKTYYEKH